jgi:Tfp pilus assembly protein PilX
MRRLSSLCSEQRGVALVTTLLFMVLMFILIAAMLTVSSNEVAISGGQRDAARALELAEGGVREAIRRIEIPHFFATNTAQECYDGNPADDLTFDNSLANGTATVKICRHKTGPSGAILEIQSDARVNLARRRISTMVRQVVKFIPPDILYGQNIAEQGNAAELGSGDAYSQSFIRYTNLPTSATSVSYGGWRISKRNPGALPACYTHADCVADALADGHDCTTNPSSDARCRWYPGQRVSTYASIDPGPDLDGKKTQCDAGGNPTFANPFLPAGAIRADDPAQAGVAANTVPMYGFMRDDPDGAGPLPPQGVTSALPCGLVYKYHPVTFEDEDGNAVTIYFKTIVYEHWFNNYWRFDNGALAWTKRTGVSPCPDTTCLTTPGFNQEPNLVSYPQFTAVPAFPDFEPLAQNADRGPLAPGTYNSGDFGACDDSGDAIPNNCEGPADRPIIVLMDSGAPGGSPGVGDEWHINGTLDGHGTILVNGDLIINGTFNYWGTIIVNGNLTLGSGNVTVYGGLVAKSTAYLTGNITVMAGGLVPNVPVGPAVVTHLTWWER